jgi:pimeloyl-ACP methyl ester carboxylesterase
MLGMRQLTIHLSVAVLALTTAGAGPAWTQTAEAATFVVLAQGVRIGSERVTVTRTADGWQIRATGQLNRPVDLVTTQFDMTYSPAWRPRRLAMEGRFRGQLFSLATSFGPEGASNALLQGGQRASNTQQVASDAVVLPNNSFAAYEALAARLAPLDTGAAVPVYIAPETAATATIGEIRTRRISTPDGAIDVREYALALDLPAGPMVVIVWVDRNHRLARVAIPGSNVVALRDDLASVLAREEIIDNPTDEDVYIPSSGFSLGATISTPTDGRANARPIILVSGTGEEDRERVLHGVPVYGRLAGALADAGFFVVRYDRRGLGQSGGRTETTTLEDLAGDVRGIVSWLRRRDDVDDDRIAVLAHGARSAAVALLAARQEGRVKAVGLLGVPAGTGLDVTMAEQRAELAQLALEDTERQRRVALQQSIINAVLTGDGWDDIPPALRRQADTPLFRSWLQFDLAEQIDRIDEPLLILRGEQDRQATAADADRLEQLSAARGRAVTFTRKVTLPGLDHQLAPDVSGGAQPAAAGSAMPGGVAEAIASWLNQVMPERR